MNFALDVERVAGPLPHLDRFLADPRVRPICLVGGFTLVLVGAFVQLTPISEFWATAISGVLLLVGVPLFCLGLAAAEPENEGDPFRLGIQMGIHQRRLVGIGSLLIMTCPLLMGAFVPLVGLTEPVRLAAAFVAFVGAVLILTGFIAWTSRTIGETTPTH